MGMYDHNINAILAKPLKYCNEIGLLHVTTVLHHNLASCGLKPTYQILDNECPASIKHFLRTISFQLVPPINAAEWDIQTYKSNFISGLRSCDPFFPLHLLDHLVPQATLTLNLMRSSLINLRLSAKAQLNGAYYFNPTPLAPPVTRIMVNKKTVNCRTWAPHGVNGWYIGQAREHYRCYCVYMPTMRAKRISKTVDFFRTLAQPPPDLHITLPPVLHALLLNHCKPLPNSICYFG